jgi:osmoprotectant transport system substrate-binding protein
MYHMKKILFFLIIVLSWAPWAISCTNFPINIGAMDTLQGRILVESLSVLINERTGVTVGTHYFNSLEEMDKAVAEKRLEIIIQDTSTALMKENMVIGSDPEQNFATLEELYKSKEMIWLKPFAFEAKGENGLASLTAPVISRKSLSQFPALPRLIKKLTQRVDDKTLSQLLQNAEGMTKPKTVAKDFLKEQSLI